MKVHIIFLSLAFFVFFSCANEKEVAPSLSQTELYSVLEIAKHYKDIFDPSQWVFINQGTVNESASKNLSIVQAVRLVMDLDAHMLYEYVESNKVDNTSQAGQYLYANLLRKQLKENINLQDIETIVSKVVSAGTNEPELVLQGIKKLRNQEKQQSSVLPKRLAQSYYKHLQNLYGEHRAFVDKVQKLTATQLEMGVVTTKAYILDDTKPEQLRNEKQLLLSAFRENSKFSTLHKVKVLWSLPRVMKELEQMI